MSTNFPGQTPWRPFTYVLTGGPPLTIVEADNVTQLSILCISGSVTVVGSAQFANTAAGSGPLTSAPITLSAGQPLVFTTPGGQAPIDGVTINATGGSCALTMKM